MGAAASLGDGSLVRNDKLAYHSRDRPHLLAVESKSYKIAEISF
ncbi:hypothetical protein [Cyanobium sp. WKJ7-Wakatipu]|jgi:hypothetical protein|nr:hypothetical protein [Cyanobium sp. WKJ7-Wakatipu]